MPGKILKSVKQIEAAAKMRDALCSLEGSFNREERFIQARKVAAFREVLGDEQLATLYRIIREA